MQLTLLSYGNSYVALLHDKVVRYDKSLGLCYTGNPDVDSLINPDVESNFAKTLWRAKFSEYCIVTNAKLGENIVFLYGNNLSGKPVYLVFVHPVGLMPSLFQQGLVLNSSNLILAGMGDQSMLALSLEEKTKLLFANVNSYLNVVTKNPASCLNQFSYFNSNGELFHTDYKTTVVNNVVVDQASNTRLFCMKF
ncbi:hypothetical protein [Ehrlichia japonica]|uniref:Uncharacterized protein n=1 Tax=Ehrlichia japonica TaxID=391036 RepID=X5GJI5_9RICK|nr:hypothetical protein [Ehrlichia japonica]AHX04598.1 hypothetical protein EHF_0495 [Ehrlichia japonica]